MTNLTKILQNTATLAALSALSDSATRGVRAVGATVRIKTSLPTIDKACAPQLYDAVKTLASLGHRVRLFEGEQIFTARVAQDGVLVWAAPRVSRTDRSKSGAVVEVML